MTKQNNRTCIICRKEYHYCPNCGEDAGKPTWYFVFDSQNCKDIYDICTSYRDKEITIGEAYKKLQDVDLSGVDDFADATKAQIKEIMSYKTTEPSKESVVDNVKASKEEVSKTSFIKNKNRK